MKNIVADEFCAIKNFWFILFPVISSYGNLAVHFIWKADPNDINVDGENTKLVVSLRGEQKTFYSRASWKIIKKMLHRIGAVKSYKAEFIIRTLLGDASAPVNETENVYILDETVNAIVSRFDRYVRLGEDILCDLRENNGLVPKFDEFWDIVSTFIDDKTAVDDGRHCNSMGDSDVVVSMTMATNLANI